MREVVVVWCVSPSFPAQGMTAVMLVTQAYEVKAGDCVLVHAAAGGTGRLIAQAAAAAGGHVIGTVSTPEKAEVARQAGCHDVILYSQQVGDSGGWGLGWLGGGSGRLRCTGKGRRSGVSAGRVCQKRLQWWLLWTQPP